MIAKAHHQLAKRINKGPMKALVSDQLLEILVLLFSEEEALLVSRMPMMPASAEKIAKRAHRRVHEARPLLDRMGAQGLIFAGGEPERKYFFLGFMPGIYEFYTVMGADDEKKVRFAELYEDYYNADYAANAAGKRQTNLARIIPVGTSVPHTTGVMSSDEFREIVDRHDAWAVATCACKKQNELIGKGCDKPQEVCMQFGSVAPGAVSMGFSREVSREEITEIIDRSEAAGLVHITDNVELPHMCCNCCGCCCDALASLNSFNTPAVFANSRYVCEQDEKKCVACGECVKACSVGAIQGYEKKVRVQSWRCIGCGVCVSRCKTDALRMASRPESPSVPGNYGQMIIDGVKDMTGIRKYTDSFSVGPRFSRLLGDWLQGRMSKMADKD